ncbi:ATP-dependent DNA helicase [Acidianus sp. HS-5]|uniref:ATP-dependent DNA helicase n=1 Tax=Acidianus sp. HS-5 TaxID=2886040 RepID=UPI001F38E9E4|nr:ATP-dependent DNA helicase [Acidianus sp. HS-5]BDC19714.1 DEAD/DEAH box helicase [Acidianus sp. HS-5]
MDLRDWQVKLKERVLGSLKKEFLVALNSPTGSGKTLFSLVVGTELKGKILYVVRTHNEYYPVYRESKRLGKNFSFMVSKTLACPFSTADANPEDIKCSGCDIFSSIPVRVDDYPFSFLSKLKKEGEEEGFCPYYSLLDSLSSSEVVVLTYPYFFIPRLREALGLDLSQYVIVIDEAHNLDRLNELEERKLNSMIIDRAISQTSNSATIDILRKIKDEVKRKTLQEERYILIQHFPKLTDDEMEVIKEEYEALREKMIKEKRIRQIYLNSIIKFYESDGKVFSYKGSLVKKPITPEKYVSILNDSSLSVILMSGTLQSKEFLREVLGITKQIDYIDAEKEMKKKLSGSIECILALDVTSAYSLRTKEMWKKYASYILKIFYQSQGYVLAVFSSYMMMNEVMSLVNLPKLVENEKTNLEDVYRLKEKAVIAAVARGKLSEGIELTKDGRSLISDVVLVGIPYPAVDDYLKLQAEEISKITKHDVKDLLINTTAVIAVKQAIGRAIRSVNDKANVWLLDKRYDSIMWKTKINCFNPKKIKL